jgi:N-methylhydantoinase A/oxoprolinase/acetone carboxylase beta subunit
VVTGKEQIMKRIGVDVGGTFTDLIFVDEEKGNVAVYKTSSTPADPSIGVINGVIELCKSTNSSLQTIDNLFHGTTIATNLVLQHDGVKTGMITTEGFRDIIHIGRHKRPLNFSIVQDIPWQTHPVVKRRHRLTVKERVIPPRGEVLHPIDENEVRNAVQKLKQDGVDAIAVCFLFSFLNPNHEQVVKRIIREEHPEAYISLSSEVLPQFREYERFTTTALNAFIGPKVADYLDNLSKSLHRAGFQGDFLLMQSAGGVATVQASIQKPVSLLMSGPAAGALGGIWCARLAGFKNVIVLDMGGTSADISVLNDQQIRMKHLLDTKIGDYSAMVPMLDVNTIGAGGGSIAYIDEGGFFRVGPKSAGADPGPACYGLGGVQPTVTDANLVLGRLNPDYFVGGRLALKKELSTKAIDEHLAAKLGMTVEQAALGVLKIVNYNMMQAIQKESVRRGFDIRKFSLIACGGAGALHACQLAEQLGMQSIIVPPNPGILSALGLMATDLKYDFSKTELQVASRADLKKLVLDFSKLEQEAYSRLEQDRVPENRRAIERAADCRYKGQGYELRVCVPAGDIDNRTISIIVENFHEAHEKEFGRAFRDNDVEIVNIRVLGIGTIPELKWPRIKTGNEDADAAFKYQKVVVFEVGGKPEPITAKVYERGRLKCGNVLTGPAIVEQMDSTVVVTPGSKAAVDGFGNIIITPMA